MMKRQQAEHLQGGSYPYIEYAVRAAVQIKRRFKDLKRPRMNGGSLFESTSIETAHIAVSLVKAHQAMDGADRCKRGFDRGFHSCGAGAIHGNLDECAETWPQMAKTIASG
jgi:hypothetical protein